MRVSFITAVLFFALFFPDLTFCLPACNFPGRLDVGAVDSEGKEHIFLSLQGMLKLVREGWRFDADALPHRGRPKFLGDVALHISAVPLINGTILSRAFNINMQADPAKKSFSMDINIKGMDFQLLRDVFVPSLGIRAAARGQINIKADENRIFCRGTLYLYDGSLENLYYFREAAVKFYGNYPYMEIVNSYIVMPGKGKVMLGGVLNLDELSSCGNCGNNYWKMSRADPYRVKQQKIDDYRRQEHSFLSFLNKDDSLQDDFCRSYRISPHSFFIFSKKAVDSTSVLLGLKAKYEQNN